MKASRHVESISLDSISSRFVSTFSSLSTLFFLSCSSLRRKKRFANSPPPSRTSPRSPLWPLISQISISFARARSVSYEDELCLRERDGDKASDATLARQLAGKYTRNDPPRSLDSAESRVAMNRGIVFRLQLVLLDKATRKCFRYPAGSCVVEDDSRVTWHLEHRVSPFSLAIDFPRVSDRSSSPMFDAQTQRSNDHLFIRSAHALGHACNAFTILSLSATPVTVTAHNRSRINTPFPINPLSLSRSGSCYVKYDVVSPTILIEPENPRASTYGASGAQEDARGGQKLRDNNERV